MNDVPDRELVVFTEALPLSAGERKSFLDRECGGDAKMRHRVEALLQSHERVGNFLEESLEKVGMESRLSALAGEKPGDRIGHYKLLQQIGEGGCGVVYMAEQEEPVRRRVALKVIKPGMDTKSVIARFEAERQALALMDHPAIAKVLEAGTTQSGRPYFVMELVRGTKITEYCDENSLTTEERLNLFVQVCQAVQHAHQKGIIHRDIKPSNILVTATLEGGPLPVVIDFGIAKAISNQRLTDKTVFTAYEMLIGTPAYMSPEQAEMSSVDVDTRSDIYSLGVLLYELLTGSTPFDASESLKSGLDEVRRVIREQETIRPSTRLSKMTHTDVTSVALHRKSEPPRLIRSISGDLDWIVMKAMEKNRTRRYETANGLALDVQRYLANESVLARPPSKFYKFQKLVSRNKLVFGGVGVIALVLVLALVIVSASLAKERRSRREAQAESAKSRQITRFLEDMLQGVGPSAALGRDTTMLREILDRTAERVGKELNNQPGVDAELRSLIGKVYFEIGNYEGAEKMHRAALAINEQLSGSQSAQAAASLNDLGLTLLAEGKLAEAEQVDDQALAIQKQLFGNENADVATSINNLASAHRQSGKLTESEEQTREALRIRIKLFGNENLDVADSLRNLAIVLGDQGKWIEAEATARQVLEIRRHLLGKTHPLVASSLDDLAWVEGGMNHLDEAESLEREALDMRQNLLGEEHPSLAKSLYLIGDRMRQRGDASDAHAVLSAALSVQKKLLGEESPDTLYTMRSLASTLEAEGKLAEAEQMHRETMAVWNKLGEGETPQAVSELGNLVHVLMHEKKFIEGEQLLDEVLTPSFTSQPASTDLLALDADLAARRGEWQKAANNFALAFEHQPSQNGLYSPLAALLVKTQNHPAYEQLRKKLLANFGNTTNVFVADAVAKSSLFAPPPAADLPLIAHLADVTVTAGPGEDWAMPYFEVCKALSEYRQGHFIEAIDWAQKSLQVSRVSSHGHAYAVLAMANWQLGRKDEARAMLLKGEEVAPEILPVKEAEDLGNGWQAWLFARISLEEAQTLIHPELAANKSSDAPR